jgi:DNA polymerase-3 subunit epsilon
MDALVAQERFEDAGMHRDRLAAFIRACARTQRLTALTRCPELVAAECDDTGRWQVHVLRFGRLAAAGVMPDRVDAKVWVEQLVLGAETVPRGIGPTPAASAAETERLARWLERPGVRLVRLEGEWSCPVAGASRHVAALNVDTRASLVRFDEQRLPTPVHQPAR